MPARHYSSDGPIDWFRRGQQSLLLGDVLGEEDGTRMGVGFARFAAGEELPWTTSYDEALVVTKGSFETVTELGTCRAQRGDVIYLDAGTTLTYRAVTDSEVVYVTSPPWLAATQRSPHAARLEEFRIESIEA